MYNLYFDEDEIELIQQIQNEKLFDEIIKLRELAQQSKQKDAYKIEFTTNIPLKAIGKKSRKQLLQR